MRNTIKCLLAIAFSFSFAACQKEIPTKLTGYFYTTDLPTNEAQSRLFVDGVDQGVLPYIDLGVDKMTSIDSSFKSKALKLEFMSGRHQVQSKDASGKIISSSEMYFEFYKHKIKSGVSGNIGASGHARFDHKNEVAIWLAGTPK